MRRSLVLPVVIALLILVSGFLSRPAVAQSVKERKNVVRWNMTPWLLWENASIVVGYERVINKNMSASLNVGRLVFPKFVSNPAPNFIRADGGSKGGASIAADFRFYLNRNKFGAPDGVYIGPYYAHYVFRWDRSYNITDGAGAKIGSFGTEAFLQADNIGIELGYQFIIKKRVSIDFILIGPSISWYYGRIHLKGDLDPEIQEEVLDAIRDATLDRFPWVEGLLQNQEITREGRMRTAGFGFRYVIQVGIYF
ncbi:hypothetical protein [Persicobacter sp. CCB-QB2]|uniref:hypothetical protein n=1 Tax=Persicobacter sp. CCB-QB2 TaxID=1561025 RepID=UPI0006A9720E|nr:hypothetical protein [Persicobacter sp. CCB-QB2]